MTLEINYNIKSSELICTQLKDKKMKVKKPCRRENITNHVEGGICFGGI